MSKVYEHELAMEELTKDMGWIEHQEKMEAETRADMDNMEENKAKQFAHKLLENERKWR